MTKQTSRRRSKRVLVTTERDPQAASSLARVLTNAALSRARLETAARADHQAAAASLPLSSDDTRVGNAKDPHA